MTDNQPDQGNVNGFEMATVKIPFTIDLEPARQEWRAWFDERVKEVESLSEKIVPPRSPRGMGDRTPLGSWEDHARSASTSGEGGFQAREVRDILIELRSLAIDFRDIKKDISDILVGVQGLSGAGESQ